jgi:pyruvate/2-oxoglutarate dehydrogenase complex dihydrolipoamide dehydrogenase (E3) component
VEGAARPRAGVSRELRVDLAVVGAGSGGLSVAAGAAQLGLSVALFERAEMGGDCLNVGCVPSKSLLAAAHAAQGARDAARFGVRLPEPEIDFPAVMAHVRGVIASIAPHDSQARFEGLGVTVIREHARFADPRTLESDSVRVVARRVVLATGSRPELPPVPGLADTAHLTNETIFELTERPEHLVVLGAGPIGVELGQAFRRLGARVTILEPHRALGRDDPEAARLVADALRREGVDLREGVRAGSVRPMPGGVHLQLEGGGALTGSHLLVAAGRKPTLDGLNLQAAAVACTERGVTTDHRLRTSNRRVYAIGDVAGRGAFTHEAGAHASLFVRHALFAQPINADALVVPRVTYTDPELASVGLTEAEARAADPKVRVLTAAFAENDRARAESATQGFGKLLLSRGKVVGVTIVGAGAGEHILPWVLVLGSALKPSALAGAVAPYPTRGEINKRLASAVYTETLFSPRTRRLVALLKHLR